MMMGRQLDRENHLFEWKIWLGESESRLLSLSLLKSLLLKIEKEERKATKMMTQMKNFTTKMDFLKFLKADKARRKSLQMD